MASILLSDWAGDHAAIDGRHGAVAEIDALVLFLHVGRRQEMVVHVDAFGHRPARGRLGRNRGRGKQEACGCCPPIRRRGIGGGACSSRMEWRAIEISSLSVLAAVQRAGFVVAQATARFLAQIAPDLRE